MGTSDPASGKTRGFVAVTRAPGAGDATGPKPSSRLRAMIATAFTATFLLGTAAGFGLHVFLARRRARRQSE